VRRLHLKLYLAIVGTMVVFLIAGTVVWHHLVAPSMAMGGIESATQLAAEILNKGDRDPAREREVVSRSRGSCTRKWSCTTRRDRGS
jgi:hypothetical protein